MRTHAPAETVPKNGAPAVEDPMTRRSPGVSLAEKKNQNLSKQQNKRL